MENTSTLIYELNLEVIIYKLVKNIELNPKEKDRIEKIVQEKLN